MKNKEQMSLNRIAIIFLLIESMFHLLFHLTGGF